MGRKSTNKERIEDKERKRNWVIALFPFFQEKGIRQLSMENVASCLNISKATLYKYFSSREEIIESMMEWKLLEIRQFESALTNPDSPFIERFLKALKLTSIHITGISNIFLLDLKNTYPEIYEKITHFLDFAEAVLANFYREGISKGEINNINPIILAVTDRWFLRHITDPEFLDSNKLSIEEALRNYFLMKFGGIFKRPVMSGHLGELTEQFLNDWVID